jgi:hypothetical protein
MNTSNGSSPSRPSASGRGCNSVLESAQNEGMRRWIAAAVFALIACQESPTPQVIRLDDAHNAMSPATANGVPNYSVHSGTTYVLDSSTYALLPPAGAPAGAQKANYVNVVSPSGMYAFDWPAGANRITLDSSHATPLGTSPPFPGFKSGESVIVMVGYSERGSTRDKLRVVPFWLGRVSVL